MTEFNERQTTINGRTFEILGDSTDDYYNVFGATKEEVYEYQFKLASCVYSKLSDGRFTKLRDAKEFIKLVVGEA